MSLIQGAKRDIVSTLNRESKVVLDYAGLIIGKPATTGSGALPETKIRITALPTYAYRGTQVITYDRLRLQELPGLMYTVPRMPPLGTLYELLPWIADQIGILFTTDDLSDAPVVVNAQGDYSVSLVAKPLSHGWVGSCVLNFTDLPPISLAITNVDIGWT
ncbi:hypothetical protein D3C85_128270 [compost metagenome]